MTGAPTPASAPARLASLDAYRGLVMLLMMGEVLRFCEVAAARPDSGLWAFLCRHQDHVPWVGGSLHDMIQPSFSFLVGAALPFSLAARGAAGQARARMIGHAAWRAMLLVLLGIWLRSIGKTQTNFTFEDTLTQIGLGYVPLFLLALRPAREQWAALGVVLVGYWAAFALYPLPPPGFDYAAVGVPPDWPHHLQGFAAHWNKNSNLAWAFDVWFLNLFPRETPFLYNGGGYATLSFIPTLGTMIVGLLAGERLRRADARTRQRFFVVAGLACVVAGVLLGAFGICPVVKRIWTPGFTLWSGGICLLLLAAFHEIVDRRGHKAAVFPLVVVGTNSIAAYLLAHLWPPFIEQDLKTHFGEPGFAAFGGAYAPVLRGACVLLVLWLVLLWMYRRRLFLRI
jgi:predicted acyltransferase